MVAQATLIALIQTRSLNLGTTRRSPSPSSRGHHGVEEQVSPIAPRTPIKPNRRTRMKERASCPLEDPMRLALQGQGLTVNPSCQSCRRLSRKQQRK